MLMNTFRHIPGIGEKIERALWEAGVTSWGSALPYWGIRLPRSIRLSWSGLMLESIHNHANGNPSYFAEKLPCNQHWRLYRDFQDTCAFLDIETTGLSGFDEITTIVLYDGKSIRHYINGENLDAFPSDVSNHRLLVTYCGKTFDIPFIERFFGIQFTQAHIDLRWVLWSLGLKGGLKGCERLLRICRPGLEDIDGFIAPLLWNEYRSRDDVKALETLLAYNIQDALSLHTFMVHAYNENVKATPFSGSHSLPAPLLPESPFRADYDTVQRVRHRAFASKALFVASPSTSQ